MNQLEKTIESDEEISIPEIKPNCCSSKNFKIGDNVRIFSANYLQYSVMYAREGIVIDPNYFKKSGGIKVPAIKLFVKRLGNKKNGKIILKNKEHKNYSIISYESIFNFKIF